MAEQILKGLPVSGGTVTGNVKIITNIADCARVEYGDIMVVPKSHPGFAVGVMNAGGLICQEGGRLAHICIVSLEMGIPCITQAENVVELLRDVKEVTLDGGEGVVYHV
ncbi:MAG: hypothetical protein GY757_39180 [bacterium]|nr:hypothetical protein [bacterium]